MSDHRIPLAELSAFDGKQDSYDGIQIAERTNTALFSVSIPAGEQSRAKLNQTLATHFQLSWPKAGHSSRQGSHQLLGIGIDQSFLMLDDSGLNPAAGMVQALQDVAYVTDQSDSWAMIQLSGPRCCQVLERVCPLDLDDDKFRVDSVSRNVDGTSWRHYFATRSRRLFAHVLQIICSIFLAYD